MEGRRRLRRTLVGVVVALLLAAGACSDDDGAGSEADATTSPPETRPLTEEETLALDGDVLGPGWTTQPAGRPVVEEDDASLEVCLGREGASEHAVSERFSDQFVRNEGREARAAASVLEVDDPDVATADLEARRTAGPDCLADLYRDQVGTDIAETGTTADIDANVIPLVGADDALRIRLTLTLTSDEDPIPTQYVDLVLAVDGVHEVSLTFQSSVSPVPDDLQVRLLEAARAAI